MSIETWVHTPVMVSAVVEHLNLKPGMTVVDATVGTGGHAEHLVPMITPGGRLIGIDRDRESLTLAAERLHGFRDSVSLVHQDFRNLNAALDGLGVRSVDAVLFDLGLSSFQLETQERGFSFRKDGPLDMRMDRTSYISAYDLVNNLSSAEISSILLNFGQEHWHRRIAENIVRERSNAPVATTYQLSQIIAHAVPGYARHRRIHPATKTFQAFRIAVNRELEALQTGLQRAVEYLSSGGRLCVISFHSLEDRLVKNFFKGCAQSATLQIITRTPLVPLYQEVRSNVRSRSAKLRVAQKP